MKVDRVVGCVSNGLAILLIIGGVKCHALSCAAVKPCERIKPGSIVFIGRVVGVEDLKVPIHASFEERTTRVRLSVREIFVGLVQGTEEATVETSKWMIIGKDYLLDVERNQNGTLSRMPCGLSGAASEDDEFLRYLRARKKGMLATSLTVRVSATTMSKHLGVTGADVVVRGPKGEQRAKTNREGIVVIDAIAAGSYSVSASKPTFREDAIHLSDKKVEVLDQTCPSASIYLESDSSVTGVLRLADGEKVSNLGVELVAIGPEDRPKEFAPHSYSASTNKDGEFLFENVFPGRYLLGTGILYASRAPRTYYPGRGNRRDASEIAVDAGARVGGLRFTLPYRGARRRISVCVVDQAGRPIVGARINDRRDTSKDPDRQFSTLGDKLKTVLGGCLWTEAFEEASYAIGIVDEAYPRKFEDSERIEIHPGKDPVVLRVVVRPALARR